MSRACPYLQIVCSKLMGGGVYSGTLHVFESELSKNEKRHAQNSYIWIWGYSTLDIVGFFCSNVFVRM